MGTPRSSRLVGALLAVAGVALLVIGLITLRGRSPEDGNRPPGAAPGSSTSAAPSAPSTRPPGASSTAPATTGPATTAPTTTATPTTTAPAPSGRPSGPAGSTAPRVPVTVLNNSKVTGLGERVADQARGKGWPVSLVGNFAGRIPVTTIYFTPGDAAGQRAAQQFAAEFPAVRRVFPRYEGLPPTPAGIVLVVTRDWLAGDP